MATTRLTNVMRDTIMQTLMRRAFKSQCEDWAKRFGEFVLKVHRDVYGDNLSRMEALPEGWLPHSREIRVRFGGDAVTLFTTGEFRISGSYELTWPSEFQVCDASKNNIKLMVHTYQNNDREAKIYDARHALSDEYQAFMNELTDLREKINNSKRTARAALDSVHTVQKLIEIWPEVETFAKEYIVHGERKALLPDVPRAQLNAALNLPPEEANA